MLVIRADLVEAIVAHARAEHPDEACGVLAGPGGSDRPERHIPMINAERSSTFYRFDSQEQLKVWRALDHGDEVPVVIYHSHTATEAYPSRTDVNLGRRTGAHYVLVSTREPGPPRGAQLSHRRRRRHGKNPSTSSSGTEPRNPSERPV